MTKQTKVTHHFSLILEQFLLEGNPANIQAYGSGHIHDTYRIINAQPEFPDYLLQCINHRIFKDIPALTENIQRVTTHLRKKLETIPGAKPEKEVLHLILTKDNKGYYKDNRGNFWRMYYYLDNTRSYDIVHTIQQAYEGGKAFGKFQALLSDMDAGTLHEILPDFHNIQYRLKIFEEAIKRSPRDRVELVSDEIAFVKTRRNSMCTIYSLGQQGKLPLRTTHNDTKFNNVLFNSEDKAQCVIDLDTVMPGYIAYDFGDAIRTIANSAAEDEKDLEKIKVDIGLFKGFSQGYLEETMGFISEAEINSLSQGALLLPFIIGLRFLTDYIDGDNYYKISFPHHNLQRAKAQFRLVEELEKEHHRLKAIIQHIATSNSGKQTIKENIKS